MNADENAIRRTPFRGKAEKLNARDETHLDMDDRWTDTKRPVAKHFRSDPSAVRKVRCSWRAFRPNNYWFPVIYKFALFVAGAGRPRV